MKVALVHDYIKEYGGAERVLEVLHEIYPDADVFTSVYMPSYLGPHRERFQNWKIKTSWLQYVPFKAKLISPFRLLSPWIFRSFDFSGYDVIITSATGAYFPNTLDKKKAKLICYCHTPPRYLYGYATARNWKKNRVIAAGALLANHFLRIVDFNASKNVDLYIANSEEVKARIQKFYRREAIVINPPIEMVNGIEQRAKGKGKEYYVTGGRLARAKHVDLIVQAATEMKIPLKVFGKAFAGYGEELEVLAKGKEGRAKSTVQFLGEVSDEEKFSLLSGAKAFLFASEDEDFGILPVEAMSVGSPVIAHNSGGVRETVVEGKTGTFFTELTIESLRDAIKRFEKMKMNSGDCIKQAKKFRKEHFVSAVKKLVEENSNARTS